MKLKKIYKDGIMFDSSIFIMGDGELYKVEVPLGIMYTQEFLTVGNNEQEALDNVADFIESNKMTGIYETYDSLWDKAIEDGISFDEYEQRYICCGNHGIYLSCEVSVQKMKEGVILCDD